MQPVAKLREKQAFTGSESACAWLSLHNCSLSKLIFSTLFLFSKSAWSVGRTAVQVGVWVIWARRCRPLCCVRCQEASLIPRLHRAGTLWPQSDEKPPGSSCLRFSVRLPSRRGGRISSSEKAGVQVWGSPCGQRTCRGSPGTGAGGDTAAIPGHWGWGPRGPAQAAGTQAPGEGSWEPRPLLPGKGGDCSHGWREGGAPGGDSGSVWGVAWPPPAPLTPRHSRSWGPF